MTSLSLQILPFIMMFYDRSIPVRFAAILVSPKHLAAIKRREEGAEEGAPLLLTQDLSELVTQVFLYLEEELGTEQGFRFVRLFVWSICQTVCQSICQSACLVCMSVCLLACEFASRFLRQLVYSYFRATCCFW
jgi:hypothetical protein